MFKCALLAGSVLLVSGVAHGAPATQAEADRLTSVFEAYVGQAAPGRPAHAVVTPTGDAYEARIDLQAISEDLLAAFKPAGMPAFSLTIDPFVVTLAPRSDGLWALNGATLPVYAFQMGAMSQNIRYTGVRWSGVFDPAMRAFTTYTAEIAGMDSDGQTGEGHSHAHFGATLQTLTAAPDPAGGLAMSSAVRFGPATVDASVTPSTTGVKPASPLAISYTVESGTLAVSAQGLRAVALADFWTYLVGRRFDVADDLAAVKAKVRDLLPMFGRISESLDVRHFVLNTPIGTVGLEGLAGSFNTTGLVDKAETEITMEMSGLSLPPAIAALSLAQLAPTRLTIGLKAAGLNLGTTSRSFVEAVRPASTPPLTVAQMAVLAVELIPDAGVLITVSPTRYESSLFDVEVEGQFQVGRMRPTGQLQITAHNVDAAITALEPLAKNNAQLGQTLAGLRTLQVISHGTPDGGETWELNLTQDGSIALNGIALGKTGP